MVWLGFAVIWMGYGTGLYGYSLIRGYNLSAKQVFSPAGWYAGKWPPQPAGNTQILPSGKEAATQTTALVLANAPPGQAATGAGGGPAPGQPVHVASTATIRAAATARGWGKGGQWNALTHLINGESGGNSTARNPSSGALGIAQALGHGTSCSAGTLGNEYGPQYGLSCKQAQQANSGNATQQIRWMLGYIHDRYGTPVNAWNTWLSRNPHWY